MSDTTWMTPPVFTMQRAREFLGEKSQTNMRHLIATGKIRALRDGKKLLPTVASLKAYLDSLPDATINDPFRDKP